MHNGVVRYGNNVFGATGFFSVVEDVKWFSYRGTSKDLLGPEAPHSRNKVLNVYWHPTKVGPAFTRFWVHPFCRIKTASRTCVGVGMSSPEEVL